MVCPCLIAPCSLVIREVQGASSCGCAKDNEWGYSNRLVDLAIHMSQAIPTTLWYGNKKETAFPASTLWHAFRAKRIDSTFLFATRTSSFFAAQIHIATQKMHPIDRDSAGRVATCWEVDGVIPPPAKIESIKASRVKLGKIG